MKCPHCEKEILKDEVLGATGEYPDGKMHDGDEGALFFAIIPDHDKKRLVIDFGKKISWIALPPEGAAGLAHTIMLGAVDVGECDATDLLQKVQIDANPQKTH